MIVETGEGIETGWPPGLVAAYTTERVRLVRAAYLICGSRGAAEDAVHDALVRVAPRWRDAETKPGYLYVAVVNAARDVVRRERRRHTSIAIPDAGDHAELSVASLALRDALATLSERQRIAVVLRYFVDWTDDDIAECLHARPATVRSLLRRGIAHLREELHA